MSLLLALAWRNIWRNRRRTLITVAAVAFSVTITLYTIAMMDGSHDAMLLQAMRIFTGSAQVHRQGYWEDPGVDKSFLLSERLLTAIERTPGVKALSPRLQSAALAANEKNSLGTLLVGVLPGREQSVTVLAERLLKGDFLVEGRKGKCVIGEKMADLLGAGPGDPVVFLAQGIDGSMGALKLRVVGIFRTGTDEMDRGLVLIALQDMQDLLNAPGMANTIAVMTESMRDADAVTAAIRRSISDGTYDVMGWKELMPELVQFVVFDSVAGYIFLALLLLVIIFGVLSTIFMTVLERTREFGMMLALGTRPALVTWMVLLEAFLLTAVGVTAGTAAGLGLSWHGVLHPIQLPCEMEGVSSHWGMENKIFFAIYPLRMSIAALVIVLLSLGFSLYPAWRASRLEPDKALRTVN
jgi:ABC-type lipoprotein release transport system permease subunit